MSIVPYDKQLDKWVCHKAMAKSQSARILAAASLSPTPDALRARGARMASCASMIEYTYCPQCGSLHIARTNLCRDRLCPLCAWRLALQRIGETVNALKYIYEQGFSGRAALLTLTVKNCSWADLGGQLQTLTAAWHKLTKRREFARYVVGWARSVEITQGAGDTLHPHLHILLLYRDDKCLPQSLFCDLWRESLDVDYTPVCDVRRPYTRDTAAEYETEWSQMIAATVEATKYICKAETLLNISSEQLILLASAVQGVRMTGYGGIIRAARAKLGCKDRESVEPISGDVALECPKCGADTVLLSYVWAESTYLLRPFLLT